jgi:hypothetical protein
MPWPINLITHNTGHDKRIGGYHLVDDGSDHEKSVHNGNIDCHTHDRVD